MSTSIDQQFIEFVVKSLVGKPEAVKVDRRIDEKGVLLELTVDPEDLGRVIGKRGATAQSLRTLLRALGTKNDARYNLKIIDNGTGAPASSDDNASTVPADEPAATDEPAVSADESTPPPPDNVVDLDNAGEELAEAQAEAEPEPSEEEPVAEDREQSNDRLAQTRAELADLDDLDI